MAQSSHNLPPAPPFTGERLVPEWNQQQLFYAEHLTRYHWAAQWAAGKNVLDVGCGVGYGSFLLAQAGAGSVIGIDRSREAIYYAHQRYRQERDLQFCIADAEHLPLAGGTVDVLTSFETIEHLTGQDGFLDECARVLKPDGCLLLSTPNPRTYPAGNPFHTHEMGERELRQRLRTRFPSVQLFYQANWFTSLILSEPQMQTAAPTQMLNCRTLKAAQLPGEDCAFYLAVCSRAGLPEPAPVNLLFTDQQAQYVHNQRLLAELAARDQIVQHYRQRAEELFTANERLAAVNRELVSHIGKLVPAVEALTAKAAITSEAEPDPSLASVAPLPLPPEPPLPSDLPSLVKHWLSQRKQT